MYKNILNSKKIKYEVLKKLVEPKLIGVKEINCFISLNSITKNFYSLKPDEVAEDLQTIHPNALSSEIINIVAHYRHFFWSRYGIPSTYFIYYSLDMSDYCTNINIDYKDDYYAKRMGQSDIKEYRIINKSIEENLKFIKILDEYLPNIYFINTKSFEPSALPQLLISRNKATKNIYNFVFTNDAVDYQLVNNPDTSVITLNSDHSKILDQNNLISSLLTKSKTSNDLTVKISSNFYVPILSITGFKKYNIKGIKGMGNITVVKKLNKLLEEGKIDNIEYLSMDLLAEYFKNENELLNNNFKVLSLKNISKNIRNSEFINIKKQLINKSDNMSLLQINNKYYVNNPLMLIELMEGEE